MTDLSSQTGITPAAPDHLPAPTGHLDATVVALPAGDVRDVLAPADGRGPASQWQGFVRRVGAWLEARPNRIAFGLVAGVGALLLKVVLNAVTGQETGYIAYYLLVAISAATGGMSSGLTTTAIVVIGQGVLFYEPMGSVLIGNTANMIRLALFAISGVVVSLITNGLLRARLHAEAAGVELTRLVATEAAARQAAEDAGRRTQILFETAAALSDALSPEDVAGVVIRQGVVALGAVGGAVHRVSQDRQSLVLLRADGYPRDVIGSYGEVPIGAETAIALVARSGAAVYLVDRKEILERFPRSIADADVAGEQSYAGLPITIEGRAIAVVSLGFGEPRHFSADDRDFHALLAQQAGQALERARLYEAERGARKAAERAEDQAGQLAAFATALAQPLTPEGVASAFGDVAVPALGARGGAVILLDADGHTLRTFGTAGYTADERAPYETFELASELPAAVAMRTNEAVICDTPEEMRAFNSSFGELAVRNGTKAIAVVPFDLENAGRGEVVLSWAEPRRTDASERAFLFAISKEVAQALLRARLHDAERRARVTAEESRSAMEFLAEAGLALGSSLDFDATVARVASLVVSHLADWCSVDVVGQDGRIQSVAATHRDPVLAPIVVAYRKAYPPDEYNLGPNRVIGQATVEHIERQTDEDLERSFEQRPGVGQYLRRLGTHSYVCVPIPGADGKVLGALTLGATEPGRLDRKAFNLATELGRRVGVAMDHARLYAEARQLVATVDAALDAVFMFEPTTLRFTYVNQGAVNQVGWSRDQLLSMSALEIKPDFDETGYRELLQPLLDASRPSITFSTTHLHRDGTRVPVEVFLQAVRLPGENLRMIVTARDIREQIEVEANLYRLARAERARAAELSAVIRGMGEGVLVCDPVGHVILTNPAAGMILGTTVDRYEDLVVLTDAQDQESLPVLGSAAGPVEVRLASSERWIDVSTYPVSLEAGELFNEAETTIIVLRDVTAARQARAAREAFIGVMSHELRTPITTIYGTTKLFRRVSESPEMMRSMLGDVEAEADRLYRLVEDLLILSRSETGIQVQGEPVLLQHVIRSVVAGESARWPETQFDALVPADLPPVTGDRTYLEQVVRNLLSNAAKYSPPGTTVEVRADVQDGEVAVRVMDTGPGFGTDEADHLFELFYRSPSTAKKATGAGIGLYVSRALIEAMGGRIWALPRAGGGAEFGFTVPILEAETEMDDLDEASLPAE